MKRAFYLPVVLCMFYFVSCKKYLDQPPNTSIGYPTTVANCQALLDNIGIMNDYVTPAFLDASSDDYFFSLFQFNSTTEAGRVVYVWNEPDVPRLGNDWILGYGAVYIANVCLSNIDKIDRANNEAGWNNVKGSGYFFRAYYFLQLAWTYAKAYDENTSNNDLGIALKLIPDLYDPTTRSSVKQTYDQIISDAKQSALYLPDIAPHPLRPSKVAAYGLLARTYLSMRIYDSALKYSDKYLHLKNELIDYNGDADLVNSFTLDVSPFRLYNKETAFYTSAAKTLDLTGLNAANVDSALYGSYDADDLRKSAFFAGSGAYKTFKGSYAQDISVRFSGLATDEMFLIRAECYARRGNKDNALNDLNTLLAKRWKNTSFVQVTASSPEQALQIILQERRKELLMRGLRWADLKRLNKEPAHAITLTRVINGQTYTLPPNDNRYALPLPQTIIEVTGMQQNPR